MLIAMLTVFLLGSGLLGGSMVTPADIDLIGERVELLVENTESAAKAHLVLDELRTEVEEFDQIFIDSGDSLRDMYLDHETAAWQMQRSLESLNLEWYESQQRGLKLRDRLRESITADEWAAVFGN
jgi:hypothetical protein